MYKKCYVICPRISRNPDEGSMQVPTWDTGLARAEPSTDPFLSQNMKLKFILFCSFSVIVLVMISWMNEHFSQVGIIFPFSLFVQSKSRVFSIIENAPKKEKIKRRKKGEKGNGKNDNKYEKCIFFVDSKNFICVG